MQKQALVVDDSRVARMTLSKLLTPFDLDIVEIASGEEALSYLQSNSNDKPDIIFMDVTMNGLNGLETTQKIKEYEHLRAIPVVMCTGHDTDGDKINAREVGAIAALTKPPSRDQLAELMAQIERERVKHEELIEDSIDSLPVEEELQSSLDIADLEMLLEKDWMPKVHTCIDEKVSRNANTEEALEAKIAANLEQALMLKIKHVISETASEISQQIITDSMHSSITTHLSVIVPEMKENLQAEIKLKTVEVAQHAAQQIVDSSAEIAVQHSIDVANLPGKAQDTLNQQGEAWLEKQEQQISLMASSEVEKNISPLISQYLDTHLAEKLAVHFPEEVVKNEKERAEKVEHDLELLTASVADLTKKVLILAGVTVILGVGLIASIAVTFL